MSSSSADHAPPPPPPKKKKPTTLLLPTEPLQLPAHIFLQWSDYHTREPQRRDGYLLYVDAEDGSDHFSPLPDNDMMPALVISVFLVPGRGLMYFSSLSVAERVLRGTSVNITGWKAVRSMVAKQPILERQRSTIVKKRRRTKRSTTTDDESESSSSSSDGGGDDSASDRAWLLRRLQREADLSSAAAIQPPKVAQQRKRQSFFPLHCYRQYIGGPGFINDAVVTACRDQLIQKIRQCNASLPPELLQTLFPTMQNYRAMHLLSPVFPHPISIDFPPLSVLRHPSLSLLKCPPLPTL